MGFFHVTSQHGNWIKMHVLFQGKSLERGDHVDVERDNRVQRERSPERVEEGEVPSTSGTIRSPPRSADKRSLPDRSLSPGTQKRHYGSREQYGNRKDGYKDGRHSSHNREHYHHHSSHYRCLFHLNIIGFLWAAFVSMFPSLTSIDSGG